MIYIGETRLLISFYLTAIHSASHSKYSWYSCDYLDEDSMLSMTCASFSKANELVFDLLNQDNETLQELTGWK